MDEMTSAFPIINNRYQISGTIATGGMAVIYRAQDLMLERRVAVKILKKDLSEDLTFQNRFRQEAKASAKLNHPNIVTTFDFGLDKDRFFIVMEMVDGVELKEIMARPQGVPPEEALLFLQQACNGLAYAHKQGFVHCDIKPQNLLVTAEKILKITDFGISRALETISKEEHNEIVWGSPFYISPEQSAGKAPSPASDIYSLGIIAYELFSKQLPFNADDSSELTRKHRMEIPKPLSEVNPDVSPELNKIVMQCLEKDPTLRFKSAADLEKAFSSVQIPLINRSFLKKMEKKDQKEKNPGKETPKLELSTILLSLLALILAGGLIPFWLYIVLSINSINR